MSLSEMEKRESEILKKDEENKANRVKKMTNKPLSQVFGVLDEDDEDDWDTSCIICYL